MIGYPHQIALVIRQLSQFVAVSCFIVIDDPYDGGLIDARDGSAHTFSIKGQEQDRQAIGPVE